MLIELIKKISKFAWFLPGFLLWAAFPPMGEGTDILFALAPLMWLSRRTERAKLSAKRCFQSGCFYWLATLSWMPAIVKNGGPWPLVVLGWFALAAYCALFFWLYGWLSAKYWIWARESKRSYAFRLLGVLFVEPVLWCGLELVRSRFLGGFAWNQLGVVPANFGFGAPAALGGVYLLSAVVILINGTVAGIAERVWHPERSGFAKLKRWGALETVLAFTLIFAGYRLASNLKPRTSDLQPTFLKVAMVQRNFPCVFKGPEERPYERYDQLLSRIAALEPELVAMSESAMCEFGPVDSRNARAFAAWVSKKTGGSVLAGGSRQEAGRAFNSAALYRSETELALYDKVHLVPFGEFIPGDKLFPALQDLAPVGSCTPGTMKLLPLTLASGEVLPLGVSICFEDTDSFLSRQAAELGARLLVFITNDSWFSNSIEPLQHAWQATCRALETGLPVVRVGNSGVTGTISPTGKTDWLSDDRGRALMDQSGTMFDRIELPASISQHPTVYVRLGDWPLALAFILLILGMILVKYRHYYEKRRYLSM